MKRSEFREQLNTFQTNIEERIIRLFDRRLAQLQALVPQQQPQQQQQQQQQQAQQQQQEQGARNWIKTWSWLSQGHVRLGQPVPLGWVWPRSIGARNSYWYFFFGNKDLGIGPLSRVTSGWQIDPKQGGAEQLHQSRVKVVMNELERLGREDGNCPIDADTPIASLDTAAADAFFDHAYPLLIKHIYGVTDGKGHQNVATLYNALKGNEKQQKRAREQVADEAVGGEN